MESGILHYVESCHTHTRSLFTLVSYVHYMYITNRTLDYNTANLDVLQSVSTWMDQLGDDPDEETIQVYRDNLHKRVWFESINTFLASKKGSSGMPIAYLTRESRNPPAVDPGFGLPNFHLDLARRGRIDAPGGASSTFYAADNRTLYQLLQRNVDPSRDLDRNLARHAHASRVSTHSDTLRIQIHET